jgi:hypothetical protein
MAESLEPSAVAISLNNEMTGSNTSIETPSYRWYLPPRPTRGTTHLYLSGRIPGPDSEQHDPIPVTSGRRRTDLSEVTGEEAGCAVHLKSGHVDVPARVGVQPVSGTPIPAPCMMPQKPTGPPAPISGSAWRASSVACHSGTARKPQAGDVTQRDVAFDDTVRRCLRSEMHRPLPFGIALWGRSRRRLISVARP